MASNTTPSSRSATTPSLTLITPSSSTSGSARSSISASAKSPGSSPRSPLLLSTIEPSALSLSDDPSLDMDFELLFLHDDASKRTRPKTSRGKSSSKSNSTEQYAPSRPTSSNTPPNTNTSTRPPTATRRDWSAFNFSYYASAGTVNVVSEMRHGGAARLRGKPRIAEMYTRNRVEMGQ